MEIRLIDSRSGKHRALIIRPGQGGVKIQLSLSAHIITKGLYTTSSKMLQIYNVRIQQVYNDTMDLQTVSEVKQVELFWSP